LCDVTIRTVGRICLVCGQATVCGFLCDVCRGDGGRRPHRSSRLSDMEREARRFEMARDFMPIGGSE
jgi:hypothetical protein